jgi:Sec-independent protein translocase protein TatA
MGMFRNLAIILTLLLLLLSCEYFGEGVSAWADTTSEAKKLRGSVTSEEKKKADDELKAGIKDANDSVRQLQSNLRSLINEVMRQNYVSVMQPNVIGATVLPSVPTQIPMGNLLPPRKKYMDFFAVQTQARLGRVREATSLLPEDWGNDTVLAAQMAQLKAGVESLQKDNEALQKLLSGSTYDNLAIGKQALLMSDQLDEMQKLLKKSEKRMRKINRQG